MSSRHAAWRENARHPAPPGRVAGLNVLEMCPWDHSGLLYKHEGTVYVIDSGSARYYTELCRRPLYLGDGYTDDDDAWRMDATGVQMYPLREFILLQGEKPLHVLPGRTPWFYERFAIRRLRQPLACEELQRWEESVMRYRDRPYQGYRQADNDAETTSAAVKLCHCCGVMKNTEVRAAGPMWTGSIGAVRALLCNPTSHVARLAGTPREPVLQ